MWSGTCHTRTFCFCWLSWTFPDRSPLPKHVGRDEEAKEQQQGRRDEKLRREDRAVVVVDLGAGGTTDRAAALDYRASTVSADQVLAAHLESLPEAVPRAHLA
jgi:hypothetical protein